MFVSTSKNNLLNLHFGMSKKINLFSNLKSDFASGLVVFLVALPLCLGIALASGAPLFSGIISGIVGGVIVGYLSQSHLSVSGPAAGLTAIVLTAITDLGSFNVFLLAVLLAGLIQLILGFIKAGSISNYFPNNVIEGMLAGIGVIIILKQIPHAFGYDPDFEGDESFFQPDGQNTFSEIFNIFDHIQLGSIVIAAISLAILILWNKVDVLRKIKLIPAALVAVIVSILLNEFFIQSGSNLAIVKEHLVRLPVPTTLVEFKNIIITPDFTAILNSKVWIIAITIAIVASIETLLCIEASDRMDAIKRYTNTNVELKAQGIGNGGVWVFHRNSLLTNAMAGLFTPNEVHNFVCPELLELGAEATANTRCPCFELGSMIVIGDGDLQFFDDMHGNLEIK
jgi:MFS superfamily sulfate permease-like transporter